MENNKVKQKKEQKKQRLLDAAFNCFSNIGYNQTSIDNIVTEANVAKGTFYLYFKDKEDILNSVVEKQCIHILEEAFNITLKQNLNSFCDKTLFFANYLIDYFTEHAALFEIVERNFILPLTFNDLDSNNQLTPLLDLIIEDANLKERYTRQEVINIIYIIIEMVGSISYSSIIKKVPADIATIKPTLLMLIKRMINPNL